MNIYVDATTCLSLGTIGELELLTTFDGTIVILPQIRDEVTSEPARTNLDRFRDRNGVAVTVPAAEMDDARAREVLGESETNGDVRVIAAVLARDTADEGVAVVSDDRRVRTVARGLDATVTGTIGVIVRAVEEGVSGDEAKAIVQRIDGHGLHMTAELREEANDLIDAAAARD